MAVGGGFQIIGPIVAPLCGAFIANALGWRWVLWITAIAIGAFATLSAVLLRETYALKILERKTIRLRKETGNPRLRSVQQSHVGASSILEGATRPIQVFFRSYTVCLISVYTGVAYALSYTVLTTLTETMESQYGFGQGIVGLAFLPRSIGSILGMFFYGMTSDRYIKYKKAKSVDGKLKPEHRLVHMIVGALTQPLAFILYGWTIAYHVQWIVPLIATAIITFSMMLAILPTENYLVDAYEIYSASAVAAGNITRALFAAVLPLIGPPLYRKLGQGWGNSVLALVGAVFIPPLFLLVRRGDRSRRELERSTEKS